MSALWWNLRLGVAWLLIFFGCYLTLTVFLEGRALFFCAFGLTLAVQLAYHLVSEEKRIQHAASEQVPWWVWR